MAATNNDQAIALALAEVKGQLAGITQLLQQNHDSTNQRINDLRHALEGRLTGHEERIGKLESNERTTAIKASVSGATTGLIGAAVIEFISSIVKHN